LNQSDLIGGRALSADFTGQGWRDHLKLKDTPLIGESDAGKLLASLAKDHQFSMFEFWETDLVGHKQSFQNAFRVLEKFDLVLSGLLDNWDFESDGIIITSDHGNLEDLSTRRHTYNHVPAFFLGPPSVHQYFSQNVRCIGDITPFILHLLDE
jgi:bisphosphoglycerate-independent phosphoglycerate mutase (AlkP superfamily)